jgi:hypothetical protein
LTSRLRIRDKPLWIKIILSVGRVRE